MSSAVSERTSAPLPPLAPPPVDACTAPNAPKSTLVTLRFIALPISSVSSVPDAPTSAPEMIRTLLSSTKPVSAAASPVNELSSEITTGISAPPIGSTKSTPRISVRPSAMLKKSNSFGVLAISMPQQTTIAMRISALTTCWPGYVIGRPVISSCSFRNAMTDPEKLSAPITAVSIVVNVKSNGIGAPLASARCFISSPIATSDAARRHSR